MDLSKISNDDLIALKAGDLSRVSGAGLREYKRQFGLDRLKETNPSEYDSNSPEFRAKYDPTVGMSGLEKYVAGAQMGLANIWRGIRQVSPNANSMHGRAGNWSAMTSDTKPLATYEDIKSARALDAPLQNTPAGKWGGITGTILGTLPTAAIPGANTYAGAAAIGGGIGALQPSASGKETATNFATGAALSPLAMLGGRLIVSGAKATKAAFIDPFTKAGQERIAANTLQSMAGGRDAALEAAANIRSGMSDLLPGVKPTTAELANNAGLANLERILKNNSEFTQDFAARAAGNRNAMIGALDNIAGDASAMESAVSSRESIADSLYGSARKQGANASLLSKANSETKKTLASFLRQAGADASTVAPDPNYGVTLYGPGERAAAEAAKNAETRAFSDSLISNAQGLEKDAINTGSQYVGGLDIGDLMNRPAIRSALAGARDTAANFGESINNANPISVLHWAKKNLDGAISAAKRQGNNIEASALQSAQKALLKKIESISPNYAQARATFESMSKPINQMEVGKALRDKLVPAISDFGAQTRINPSAFASAMRNADATAANATGRAGASISDILDPAQIKSLTQVGQHLARRVNADELGRAVGSNTGQNLAGQNAVRQLLGPIGFPQNWVERSAGNTLFQGVLGLPGKVAGNLSEPNILKKLVELGLSPEQAVTLLERQAANGPGLLGYGGAIAPILSGAKSSRQ